MLRKVLAGGTALLAFAALSACSSSDDSATDPSVGGTAACDEETLSVAIQDDLLAPGSEGPLISLMVSPALMAGRLLSPRLGLMWKMPSP